MFTPLVHNFNFNFNLYSRHLSQDLGGVVSSRRQLLDRKLLGPSTYTNAASFLRVGKRGELSTTSVSYLQYKIAPYS
jgi:transcriptional accessory protein Tex/SPT6